MRSLKNFFLFTDLALEKCPRNGPRILQYLSQKDVICPRKYTRKSQNGPRKIWHVWGPLKIPQNKSTDTLLTKKA